jgi:hypothetical protein
MDSQRIYYKGQLKLVQQAKRHTEMARRFGRTHKEGGCDVLGQSPTRYSKPRPLF